jgi:hypothetical protein
MIPYAAIAMALAYFLSPRRRGVPFLTGLVARRWVWALLIAFIVLPTAAAARSPLLLAVGLMPLTVAASPAVANLAVLLGLPRAAWFFARLAGGRGSLGERQGSAGFMAAQALARRHRWTPPDAEFVERALEDCIELGTSGAAALALVAAVRGDVERSVQIFGVIEADGFEGGYAPAVRLARSHVAVDALRRGDWRRLAGFGFDWRESRLVHLLRRVAQRRLGSRSALRGLDLWMEWLATPRRRATYALVRGAQRELPTRPPPPEVAPNLAALVALLERDPLSVGPEDVAAAVHSLEELRESPEWPAQWRDRALALGVSAEAADPSTTLLRDAIADVAQAIVEGSWRASWAPPGLTGDEVRRQVSDERFRAAEDLVRELERRTRAHRDLPEIEEWRAWADARAAIEALRRDRLAPQALFRRVNHPLTAYAVRLTNVRSRRALAGNVFRHLRDLARDARASDAYALADRNCSAVRGSGLPAAPSADGEAIGMPGRLGRRRDVVRAGLLVGAIFAPMAWVAWIGGTAALLAVPLFFGLALAAHLATRVVECWISDEGLIVQSRRARHLAVHGDVRAVGAGPGGWMWIRLRRRPVWLPRVVFTLAESRGRAEELAGRIREAHGPAGAP